MRFVRLLSILLSLAVLAFLGSACGQLDEVGRSTVSDVRVAGSEQVVLVVHTDLSIPEDVAIDLARTIRLVDSKAPYIGPDVRDDLDPFGRVWIELDPPLEGLVPVVPPRSRADYEALKELIRHYARLEILAQDVTAPPSVGRGTP